MAQHFSKVVSELEDKIHVKHIAFEVCRFLKDNDTKRQYGSIFNDEKVDYALEMEERRAKKRLRRNLTQQLSQDLNNEYYCAGPSAALVDRSKGKNCDEPNNNNDNSSNDSNNSSINSRNSSSDNNNSDKSTIKNINIKKRIFHEAMMLHEEKYVTENIDIFERKRMSCGISGILDLTDDSGEGQKKLFGDEVWKELKGYFFSRYQLKTLTSDKKIIDIWKYVSASYKK